MGRIKAVGSALLIGWGLVGGHTLAQTVPDLHRLLADPDTMNRLRTFSWTAIGDFFDTAQTVVAGSRGRHASSYAVEGRWEPGGGAEYSWKLHTYYPFPSDWLYSEKLIAQAGGSVFEGVDGFRPTPQGPLPLARAAARAKLLWMSVPALLLSQAEAPALVEGRLDTVSFNAVSTDWTVHFDRATGFPIRISTREADPVFGAVEATMEYFSWTEIEGVFMPARLEYRVDGQLIRREQREALEISLGGSGEPRRFTPSLNVPRYAKGWTTAHWFLSRIALGAPADEDASEPVDLLEVADGVYQVLGSSHHSLVIESSDQLAVVDAPLYPERSEAVLAALQARWPDKPVSRLILTHHHFDHSGGVLTYAAAGIPITVHAANRDFFFEALAGQGLGAPLIESVSEKAHLTIGGRAVGLYEIPTTHAAGLLAVYVPDQALLFNADLYSPGRPTQHPLWSAELLQAIRFLDLSVERHVGGHGQGVEPMEHLEAVAAGEL